MIRTAITLFAAASLLTGCGKSERTANSGEAGTKPAASSAPVEWPELKAFDAVAVKADGLVSRREAAGLRVLLPSLAQAMNRLATSPIPANAHNPLTVKELVADVGELEARFRNAAALKDDELVALAAGLHALSEGLMHESGMPHSHDH